MLPLRMLGHHIQTFSEQTHDIIDLGVNVDNPQFQPLYPHDEKKIIQGIKNEPGEWKLK